MDNKASNLHMLPFKVPLVVVPPLQRVTLIDQGAVNYTQSASVPKNSAEMTFSPLLALP